MNPALLQKTALAAFFGLMITLVIWIVLAPHAENYPTAAMLLMGVAPMLLPLRGLLHARPYTYAWASLFSLFYLAHAVVELMVNTGWPIFPMLSGFFSLLFFVCAAFYVRANARQHS